MQKITAKEEEVLQFFWSHGPLFVKEIQQLYPDPKPHYNTLSTIVRILEEKQYVGYEVFGNTHRYYALISEEEYHKTTLKGIVQRYFNSSYTRVVSALVEDNELSIEELRSLIQEIEARAAKKEE